MIFASRLARRLLILASCSLMHVPISTAAMRCSRFFSDALVLLPSTRDVTHPRAWLVLRFTVYEVKNAQAGVELTIG